MIFAEFCTSVFAVVESGDGIGQGLVMGLVWLWWWLMVVMRFLGCGWGILWVLGVKKYYYFFPI